jgi:hypothetical protein
VELCRGLALRFPDLLFFNLLLLLEFHPLLFKFRPLFLVPLFLLVGFLLHSVALVLSPLGRVSFFFFCAPSILSTLNFLILLALFNRQQSIRLGGLVWGEQLSLRHRLRLLRRTLQVHLGSSI